MSLFEELKRRNVFRVGIAYGVAAWLLVQIADLAFDIVGVDEGLLRGVAIILALGFIPAVIFAWAFELTPEGIRRESEVNRTQSITNITAKKLDYVTIGLVICAILIVAVDRMLPQDKLGSENHFQQTSETANPNAGENGSLTPEGVKPEPLGGRLAADKMQAASIPTPPAKSIAVLPFVNMSSDSEQEYFSDGISEEILNALARVKDLQVAGRTSSFSFKDQNLDLRQIGEALGVQNILEGSVRKSGTTVRITAQLIRVDNGFHLWSDTYDRELNDVFAIQDEISSAILEQLKAHLLDDEQLAVVAPRANSEAYDHYLLAKQRIYERSRPALESAADLLDKAIAIDAAYAPAYAQRAITTLLLSDRNYGAIPQADAEIEAKAYIDKAIELDPNQEEALSALGLYHFRRPGENTQTIAALEQALAINPNLVNASNWLQNAYRSAGRLKEGLAILEGLRARDPLYRPGIGNLNTIYLSQNRLDDAQAHIEEIRPFMPNDPFLLRLEAALLSAQGKEAEAYKVAERALSIQPENYINIELLGQILDATGQFERVAEEGTANQRIFARFHLGRTEEAYLEAKNLADSGENVGVYLALLVNYGRAQDAVDFIDERWVNLDAYEEDFPVSGGGIATMLDIAYAYSVVGREEQFHDAMRRSRGAMDRRAELGFANDYLDFMNAVYYAMAGDHDRALNSLKSAVDRHYVSATKLSEGWSALKVLEGNPEYEALQVRVIDHVNSQRAELGLEPIAI